ncbi:hypothetical protein PSSHI_34820 [Photobacterium sp. R1]
MMPTWLTALLTLLNRVAGHWERHERQRKLTDKEKRLDEVKECPTDAHSDRFGQPAGRVSVNREDERQL